MESNMQLTFIEEFMSNKGNHILFRRGLASTIDYIIAFMVLVGVESALGKEVYLSTVIVWVVLAISYIPITEGLTGFTLAKYLLRIKVIDKHGNPPGILKAYVRTFFKLVEVNPLLIGGIPAGIVVLCSSYGQRLGDMAVQTFVIDCSSYNAIMKKNSA